MTITNILGGFNRGLFVSMVALLFIVIAANLLLVQGLLLLTNQPVETLGTAVALAVGIGLILVAIGLFRRARWGWLGTLLVSAAMTVLILLQLFGAGLNGSSVLQLLVFVVIFLLFVFDSGIKALLWKNETTAE